MKKEQKAETLFRGITNISDAVINEGLPHISCRSEKSLWHIK